MEARLYTLHISEKYIVLIAAVRLLKDGNSNIKKVQEILDLHVFSEEPFGYSGLYANLIEAAINNKATEFINDFLSEVASENMYYDDGIEADFRQLRDYSDKELHLMYKIEEMLMYQAYIGMEDDYSNHREKAIGFMHNHKILNGITVYKDKGIVIKKSMLFLDTVAAMLVQDIEKMGSLAFHL